MDRGKGAGWGGGEGGPACGHQAVEARRAFQSRPRRRTWAQGRCKGLRGEHRKRCDAHQPVTKLSPGILRTSFSGWLHISLYTVYSRYSTTPHTSDRNTSLILQETGSCYKVYAGLNHHRALVKTRIFIPAIMVGKRKTAFIRERKNTVGRGRTSYCAETANKAIKLERNANGPCVWSLPIIHY